MSLIRRRDKGLENRLPSLGLTLDPSYRQSIRQEPYRSNHATRYEPYTPDFYFGGDDDLFAHTVAYDPSLLFSTSNINLEVPVAPEEVEEVVVEQHIFAVLFKKLAGAIKRVFRTVLRV
ncbi:hypothetical protein HGRIS_002444 [Hohenbuehelia grisea]|uniref:Uncharacterized protein n=1 Tax=Hohenbuehelia grisea TaxID=104357 RepID=A0ABR3JL60_9AGAR